jgi:hypothetical protein
MQLTENRLAESCAADYFGRKEIPGRLFWGTFTKELSEVLWCLCNDGESAYLTPNLPDAQKADDAPPFDEGSSKLLDTSAG